MATIDETSVFLLGEFFGDFGGTSAPPASKLFDVRKGATARVIIADNILDLLEANAWNEARAVPGLIDLGVQLIHLLKA